MNAAFAPEDMDQEDGPRWRLALERALPFLIGIPLFLALAGLLYFASIAATERATALFQQQRSYEIIALARRLDASIAKTESTLARYVISMDPDTGRLYQQYWANASSELSALDGVTRSDPASHKLVGQLTRAFRDRGQTLSEIALRTKYDQKMTSLGKFHQAGKAENLAQIATDLNAIIRAEELLLRARSLDVIRTNAQNRQIATTYWLVGLVLLTAALFSAWIARSAMKDRRLQRRLANEETMRSQMLENAVDARTVELQTAYAQLQQETTDRAAAEESLRQMQKMEAVGQLTGGIAHDFNNMLAVVIGGLELAKRKIASEPELAQRHIDNAMEGANRASSLTRRLLSFARAEPHLPDTLHPDEIVRGMADLIDRTIGDQIRVEYSLETPDWSIHVDRHGLENAIINLAVNARDAMDGKGTLSISSRPARLSAGEIAHCLAGDYICLTVADTGCGMPPEILDRIFEPFFTTKPIGQGTGLGLSQIFGFIGQSGGEIRVSSEVGNGTRVEMFLPRCLSASPAASRQPAPLTPSVAAGDTLGQAILVVEDDARVLAQTSAALTELGYTPICCDSPLRASATLAENAGICLILSDVLMPDMTGPEMIASLPSAYRHIPVVFVTGYAGEISDNSQFEGHGLLRKPYTLSALSAVVSSAISGSPGSQTTAAAE